MKLLIIEDSQADYLLLKRHLQKNGFDASCHQVSDAEQLAQALALGEWEVVLSDYNVPELPFSEILSIIHANNPNLPVIVVSGTIGEEAAVDLLKQGIWDFVIKDRLARLIPAIQRVVSDAEVRRNRNETDELFRNTVEMAPFGIIIANDQQCILLANPQAETLFGYAQGELIGQHIEILIPEQLRIGHGKNCHDYVTHPCRRPMAPGMNIQGRRKDGNLFPAEITLNSMRYQGQMIVEAVIHDITKRKQNEITIKRHSRALEMLSKGNRTLLRCTQEAQLLHAMCQIAVEVGGYRMAWVGYKVNDTQQSVRPMGQAGLEQGYLEHAAISWGENARGQGPTGLAIRTGQTQIARDFSTVPHLELWREEALKRGFHSSIALPLKDRTGVFGTLSIYASNIDAFDEMELPLLEEMADDLSFGITTLRNQIAHEKAENDLKTSHALLETTLESTADAIVVTSLTGEIIRFNRKFAELWRVSPAFLTSCSCNALLNCVSTLVQDATGFVERTQAMYEIPTTTFTDTIELTDGRVIERIGQPHYRDGEIVGHVCSLRDVTEQKRHESQLTYLAHHDGLTDLPNRTLFYDRTTQAIAHASRSEQECAVLFFDLDRFKLVNDSLGHDFGDLLLIEVAKRLPEYIREEDSFARMGGDEFAILLPNLSSNEDAAIVALKLLDVTKKPYLLKGRAFMASMSIGIALYPRDGQDATTLLKHADAAMYRAKDSGGNTFKFYTNGMDAKIARHLEISAHLQHALGRNEFQVYYQPQIEITSGRIIGAEALIRWQHPHMGMVSPAEFIPIAEESHIILNIGEWVIETVFAHCNAWQTAGLPSITVAINLSARQFDASNLPKILTSLVDRFDLEHSCCSLEFEITEGMVMRNPEQAIEMLLNLKAMYFKIAIDDFGTGYSSLAYLKRFPIDKLKIDRSFIKDTPGNQEDVAITRAIIVMAHELGLKVVAEGVETEAQLAFLKEHNCDMVQGYLTGRPMPAREFEAFVKARCTEVKLFSLR